MDRQNALNVVALLSDLAARELTLWLEGDHLRYRAPGTALSPHLVTTLRQYKAELVAWLQERDAVATGSAVCALSQGQLRLWLEWQRDPHSTRSHLVSVDRLPATVNLDTLRQAAQALLDRHAVLRTVYPFPADPAATQPVQQIQAGAVVTFAVVDGTTWTQAQVEAWIAKTADLPFDLSTGPVLRMAVLRTLDDQGVLAPLLHVTIHHLATDAFSQTSLRQDLAACYEALRQGQPLPAPIAALSYHDFVRWEQDTLQAEGAQLAAFWQNYLSGEVPLLDLPSASTAPQADPVPMRRRSFAFDPQLTSQLRSLARAKQTTLYLVLLAAYEVLLNRSSQQERFLIVAPTAVRTLPGWSDTVGYFVNPLVLRAELVGNPSFTALLQRVQQSYQQVLQHQLYPHAKMLRQLQKQASLEQLSQAVAGFVFVALRQVQGEQALFAPISSEQRGMPQALTLTIFDVAGALTGMFTYDAARFDSATIERMAGHLNTLLSGIVAKPEQPIGLLPLLPAAEQPQRLVARNEPAAPLAAPDEHHTVATPAAALATATDHAASLAPITVEASAPTSYPLAYGQQALWFMQQSAPDNHAYTSGLALRLQGALDLKVLRGALTDLAARHPNLRLAIVDTDNLPHQVVQAAKAVRVAKVDASGVDAAALAALVRKLVTQPFALERGVFRATLISHAPGAHVLILSLHHLATDAGSADILTRELAHCYTARSTGVPVTLPPLAHTYADYVRWEHALIETAGTQLRAYWHAQLAGELPVLQLPLDAPRPPVQTFNGMAFVWIIEPELTRHLKALARERQVTLFTLLLAVYQVLLHRSTGQHDLLVGMAPEAGRTRPEFAEVLGYFVNLLALRSTFDPAAPPAFSAFLAHVAQTVSGALAHQHYPFPLLVQELLPRREASIPPLVQTLFLLTQREGSDVMVANDLTIGPYRLEETGGQGAGQLDLALLIDEQDDTLRLAFDYNADLFVAATIARMAGHFTELLRGIVAQPEQRIDRLPLLSAAERHQVLVAWNDTATAYPADLCIHQLFEAQVERTPEAVALVFEQQHLSYRELNARANQLAHQLMANGVGPDRLVGICTKRSVALIVGILGVLKAGGAYLPLDPGVPLKRLRFMLVDTGVTLLLTQTMLMATMPQVAPLLDLELDRADEPSTNPKLSVKPDNLAYCMYTSGSTGHPKGVLIEHHSLCNLVFGQLDRFAVTATSRVLQVVSFSFDVATGDLFTALSCGATLYLAHSDPLQGIATLTTELHQQAITHLALPASVLATLDVQPCPTLQTVIVGGEVCSPEVLRRWSQGRALFNAYGPTEATICATTAKLSADAPMQPPPIGRPLPNTQVFILDTQLQPVPVGVPGELYIGGSGVARGYLNRPALTAEKFIANPFGPGRLYQTGDRVRWRPDGNLEYLGRLDNQVKVRGFRIELGEIEAVLCQHPAVQAAVVIVWHDASDKQRLVAYVVTAQAATPSLFAELRAFLGERLPEFMLPASFVGLKALPLTPNGKVDRKALPASTAQRQSEPQYVAPQNEHERHLIALWQAVLQRDRVGMHDNFFELGGHSLLLIQLHRRLQERYGQHVTVMDLFRYPTVAALAAHLSRPHGTVDNGQPDVALERVEARQTQRSAGQRQRQLRQQVRREEEHNE